MALIPELVSPGGSMEKLKLAVAYGARAVYVGGQRWGLRTASSNFNPHELVTALRWCHQRDTRLYLTLNSFLHDGDWTALSEYLDFLGSLSVDAIIVSDLGLARLALAKGLSVHLSTQATCLNSGAARFWKSLGLKRLVLGREVSLAEAAQIKRECGLEIEMFVHGAMCMGYSGECQLSLLSHGRDGNRGGCAHNCRFEYRHEFHQGHFLSSKDLMGLDAIPAYAEAGVNALKIEGRMKGPYYVGAVTRAYATALSLYEKGQWTKERLEPLRRELALTANRHFCSGHLFSPAGPESLHLTGRAQSSDNAVGMVVGQKQSEIVVEVRQAFKEGEPLELLSPSGEIQCLQTQSMATLRGEHCLRANPGMLVRLNTPFPSVVGTLVRRRSL